MPQRSDKSAWLLALLAVCLGAGALGRYPLGRAGDGLAFAAVYAVGVVVLALPLLLGEAALGQVRRRNVVDTLGPGPWRGAGLLFALAALVLAAYLAVVGGWAARYAYASLQGDFFDDPARHFRLASQGWDALLFALGVIAVAVGVSLAGTKHGLRGIFAATATLALIALATVAAWGLIVGGGAGRAPAFAFDFDLMDGSFIVAALQQSLLPGLVGFGVVATLSARVHDRTLPAEGVQLAFAWVLVPLLVGAGLAALAKDEGVALGGAQVLFVSIPALFAAIGGTAGGVLSGLFFGSLLAGCLAAIIALLEVPTTLLVERSETWRESRALTAAGLVAYLIVIPLAFVAGLADGIQLILLAFVAPLGGLLVAVHVGWVRPEALDGFTIGEAKQSVATILRPMLRFVLPALFVALIVLGAMQILADWGAVDRGTGGLWKLVP